ncbi:MDR family MFS transporter [Demequina iriomotensis]|uniref:MDR family MFS transporter n=1 Tax=Demequina iriomotensis TaxID=1536641 RepID=UPI000780B57B|nr:MDR family MFS transporter [Demequina iriomotensis]
MTSPTTSRRPAVRDAKDGGSKHIVLLFVGLMTAMLMASLSQTILATALPTIVGELGGVESMTWVVTGYILASTIMMPVYGRIPDLLGRKPVLISAIVLFVAGSIVGGLANSIGVLIVARVLQGIGGGGLMILSQAAIADVVPARERGKYMGIMGAVFAVSSVAGPLLGGWFTEGPGWRWSFWINIPLGVLAIIAAVFFLKLPKRERTGPAKIDYLGMTLVAAATSAVVLVCTWGGSRYDWASPQILGLGAAALVLAGLFAYVETKATNPVIPLSLFKDRNFTMSTIAGLLIGVAMFGVVSYVPTYIQMVSGVNATVAGLLLIPMMGGLLIASTLSGNRVAKTGRYKMFPLVGTIIMGFGLILMGTLTISTPTWLMCMFLGIFGVGLGLGQQILVLIVQNSFPNTIVGTATASFNYFKQVGATIGSAIVGSIFASRLTEQLTANLAGIDASASGAATGSLTPEIVADLPDAIRTPIMLAYNEAMIPLFLWMVPVALAAVAVLWFVKEKTLETSVEGAPAVPVVAVDDAEAELERIIDGELLGATEPAADTAVRGELFGDRR